MAKFNLHLLQFHQQLDFADTEGGRKMPEIPEPPKAIRSSSSCAQFLLVLVVVKEVWKSDSTLGHSHQ